MLKRIERRMDYQINKGIHPSFYLLINNNITSYHKILAYSKYLTKL